MQSAKRSRFIVVMGLFWALILGVMWHGIATLLDLLNAPRGIQHDLLGFQLGAKELAAYTQSWNWDGSSMQMWVYHVPAEYRGQLRARCKGPAVIQFYDPRDSFKNNEPLHGCLIALRSSATIGMSEDIRFADDWLQVARAFD